MKKALSKKNLWEMTPLPVKATLGRILGLLPLPRVLGRSFRENQEHVHEAQWWNAERVREYQLGKLREVLKLAYEKTPFYRRMFDAVGFRPGDLHSLSEACRLPVIERKVICENLPDMCTKSVKNLDVDFGATGGMSGIPLHFYLNASRSSVEYAYLTASWERVGYTVGTPMAVLRGRTVRIDRDGLYHEYDPILRHHYYSSFHMSDENMARYLGHIAGIGPCFMHVYPSCVIALARFIRRKDAQAPRNVRGIIAESEIVYPEQREMVEDVFRCRLFSCYGHSEKLVLAAGCEQTNDYHVWPTYGYFELLDEDGSPVTTPGRRGEIVGTGFINTVMPFIRYRTGDWATYVGSRCEACGREHIILRDIRGHRVQEVLIAADGSEIPWTALNMHDDTFLRVRQFQFVQEKPGQAVLQVVPAEGFSEGDAGRIRRNLGRKLDSQLTFTVELVDAIPLTARGKAIYVNQQIRRDGPRWMCS
jgi:phenylacetate-CoA ligase